MGLNRQRREFCRLYVRDFNASRAARDAGYSVKTAYAIGSRLLTFVEVQEEIARLVEEKTMSNTEILISLSTIGRGDIGDVLGRDGGLDLEAARAQDLTPLIRKYKSVTKRFVSKDGAERETTVQEVELYSKLEAMQKLIDIKGMVRSRTVLENPDGGPLEIAHRQVTIYIPDNGRPRNPTNH